MIQEVEKVLNGKPWSVRYYGIYLRALSSEDLKISVSKSELKSAVLKWHPDLPGTNELTFNCCPTWMYLRHELCHLSPCRCLGTCWHKAIGRQSDICMLSLTKKYGYILAALITLSLKVSNKINVVVYTMLMIWQERLQSLPGIPVVTRWTLLPHDSPCSHQECDTCSLPPEIIIIDLEQNRQVRGKTGNTFGSWKMGAGTNYLHLHMLLMVYHKTAVTPWFSHFPKALKMLSFSRGVTRPVIMWQEFS